MEKVIKLIAVRDEYEINRVTEDALSVEEVINLLSNYPKDAKMVMSFDNGYMFGAVREGIFREVTIETREEEEMRNALLECEDEIYSMEYDEYCGDTDMEEKLSKILGTEVRCYDRGIDNALDSADDNYLIKSCFKCKAFGKDITIRMYYGDVTEIISCVSIDY
jgi:hypothetical protein